MVIIKLGLTQLFRICKGCDTPEDFRSNSAVSSSEYFDGISVWSLSEEMSSQTDSICGWNCFSITMVKMLSKSYRDHWKLMSTQESTWRLFRLPGICKQIITVSWYRLRLNVLPLWKWILSNGILALCALWNSTVF